MTGLLRGVAPAQQLEVERLYALEAYLLDERRFPEWLALFTDDATYSVSVREAVQPPEAAGSIYQYSEAPVFDEDHAFTTVRVKRLETRLAHAEQPPSLTRHLITNVLIHDDTDDLLQVSTQFQVYQHRPGYSEHVFYGKREDRLSRGPEDWQIAERRVVLDTTLLPRTISIFF